MVAHPGRGAIDDGLARATLPRMSPPRESAAPVLPAIDDNDDPVWAAAMRAPIDDEPLIDEERAALATGTAGSVSQAVVTEMIRKMAEDAGELAKYEEIMMARRR